MDDHTICGNLPSMGTLNSTIQATSQAARSKPRLTAAVGLTVIGLLAWSAYQLFFDFVVGWINDQLIGWLGPLLPAIFKTIAAYLLSFVAACGLIFVGIAWGYWLGLRDPLSLQSRSKQDEAQPATPGPPRTAELQQRMKQFSARDAGREIKALLQAAMHSVSRPDQQVAALNACRPTVQSKLLLIRQIGFPVPEFQSIRAPEARMLLKYIDEIQPYLNDSLFEEGAQRAAEEVKVIQDELASRKSEKK